MATAKMCRLHTGSMEVVVGTSYPHLCLRVWRIMKALYYTNVYPIPHSPISMRKPLPWPLTPEMVSEALALLSLNGASKSKLTENLCSLSTGRRTQETLKPGGQAVGVAL